MTDHSELDEDMSNSACSLKRCFACCEGQLLHDTQEKRDDRLDDTIIKAEHSSSLGFMNSEADPEHDRLQEWRERDEEASPVEEPEQMQGVPAGVAGQCPRRDGLAFHDVVLVSASHQHHQTTVPRGGGRLRGELRAIARGGGFIQVWTKQWP